MVQLGKLQWPDAGPEVVSICLMTDAEDPQVTLQLLQGLTPIATRIVQPTAEWTVPPFTLTPSERMAITNYEDLQLKVTVGVAPTSCCPGIGLPSVLYATFSNGTGTCDCLNGVAVTLTWNGNFWQGYWAACGLTELSLSLVCSGSEFVLSSDSNCLLSMSQNSLQCSPLAIAFSGSVEGSMCCSGSVDATVTTTPPQ